MQQGTCPVFFVAAWVRCEGCSVFSPEHTTLNPIETCSFGSGFRFRVQGLGPLRA